jgi:hypothetical protein
VCMQVDHGNEITVMRVIIGHRWIRPHRELIRAHEELQMVT